jgi:hypothetical protein
MQLKTISKVAAACALLWGTAFNAQAATYNFYRRAPVVQRSGHLSRAVQRHLHLHPARHFRLGL